MSFIQTLHCDSLIPFFLDKFKSGQRRQAKTVVEGGAGDKVGEGEGRCGGEAKRKRDEESGSERKKKRRERELLEDRVQSNPTSKHYLQWKERTLQLAKEKLVESEFQGR